MSTGKRVLIITYYWPPSAGSGVQRWLKFSKYLHLYGYEPVIFTPENPDFDLRDPELEREVPKTAEVLKFPIWEPYQLLRMLGGKKGGNPSLILEKSQKSLLDKIAIWLRANLLVPDPRKFWIKPSINFLGQILKQNQFQAVITTGPPHSMHLIGLGLKERFGTPWLADFRDPWSTWEFLDTLPMLSVVKSRHRKLENKVFAKADALCTISPTFQKEMQELSKREVHLLYNGFDLDDLPPGIAEGPEEQRPLHIVYTGVIDAIRDPRPFMQALLSTFGETKGEVKLTFVGRVSEAIVDWVAADPWLSAHVAFVGYVPHKEVFAYYRRAHLLLLILTDTKNAKGNIPGKMFEYMATQRPILALGDPEGDAATILREATAGRVFTHKDIAGVSKYLEELNVHGTVFQSNNLEKFDRKQLTGTLAAILETICAKNPQE
jgi:hypothetical protein